MGEAILILYLAGTGMTMQPLNVRLPTMAACQENAERERNRGHKAWCLRRSGVLPCASCNTTTPVPLG